MKQRMEIKKLEPRIYDAMLVAEKTVSQFGIEPRMLELIKIRASQLNGCGYCLDMHAKDARKLGETEQRLYTVAAWRETPFFSEQEKVALMLTEEVTHISKHGVSDEVYQKSVALLGEKLVAQILFAIMTINNWNRLAITCHTMPEPDVNYAV